MNKSMIKKMLKQIVRRVRRKAGRLYDLSRKNKKAAAAGAAGILIVAIALVAWSSGTPSGPPAGQQAAPPLHDCSVGSFFQTIARGGESRFDTTLDASRFWRKYRVRMGDMPAGVSASVEKNEGRGSGVATVNISVGQSAMPASYSLMIIYDEERGGEVYPTYCQFNLIIK